MSQWRPIDIIVVMLATVVCSTFGGAVFKAIIDGRALTSHQLDAVIVVLSSMLSIISMYVGAMIQRRIDRRKEDT